MNAFLRDSVSYGMLEVLESMGEDQSQYCSHSFPYRGNNGGSGAWTGGVSHQNSGEMEKASCSRIFGSRGVLFEGYLVSDQLARGAWGMRMVCLVFGGGSAVPICLGGLLRGLHPFAPITPN